MPADKSKPSVELVGFRKLIDLKTVTLEVGCAVLELTISSGHLNSVGSLHGGVIATMIDHAGGMAGCLCKTTGSMRKAVTLSLTTSFLAPVSSGQVTATGRKRPGGKQIFVSTIEITDDSGRLIAVGEATYRYINHKPTELGMHQGERLPAQPVQPA